MRLGIQYVRGAFPSRIERAEAHRRNTIMRIINPEKRLERFWGKVDRKHIGIIQGFVNGQQVLDMGCGYGTTTDQLTRAGFDCTGIDYDDTAIAEAKRRFPGARYLTANAEVLPFANATFDVIILRDALHHLYREAAFDKVRSEMLRVAKDRSRIIVFDPNVNFMLKTMRKIAAHKDEECDFETAKRVMVDLGYKVIHSSFNTLYSLPLSGGYVGLELAPNVGWLHSFLLGTESLLEKPINWSGLGRQLCWRYAVVGERC